MDNGSTLENEQKVVNSDETLKNEEELPAGWIEYKLQVDRKRLEAMITGGSTVFFLYLWFLSLYHGHWM